jgi:hypothetical protein
MVLAGSAPASACQLASIRLPSPRHLDAATTALAYIAGVVLVNVGFSHQPDLDWFWSLLVGGVLTLRDLAQRRWGHAVLLLMLIGAGLSFRLGAPAVALASVTAFLISESVDWLVYSTTRRSFAERVWWSVLCSAPVDTAVFLAMAGLWSWPLFAIGVASKVLAGGLISLGLRARSEVARGAVPHP